MPKPEVIERAFDVHPFRFNWPVQLGDGWVFGPAFIVWEPSFKPKPRPHVYKNWEEREYKESASNIINAAPKNPDPKVELAKKGHPQPPLKTPCKGRAIIVDGEETNYEVNTAFWRLYTASFCNGFAFDLPVLYGYKDGELRVVTSVKERIRCSPTTSQ